MLNLILLTSLILIAQKTFSQVTFLNKVPIPKNNVITEEKVNLGKKLFFDPRISKNGTVSCNSCHNVMAGGDDNRKFSSGINGLRGGRSAPTVWNSAYNSVQFWDGRAATLEEQAKGPMTNPVEMGMENHDIVINRLKGIKDYVNSFKQVFNEKESLNIENVAKAIATYERTLVTPNSKFDQFIKGNKKIFSEAEIKGYKTFQAVGCITCHSGENFAGPRLDVGTGFYMRFPMFPNKELEDELQIKKDLGRYEVTKLESDKNMFRVPTLRNIALTAPYFHNGSASNLKQAIKVMGQLQLNKKLSNEEIESIETFLKTLSGQRPKQTMPLLPIEDGESHIDTN